jgi:type II secretory pathway component PulF
MPIEIAPPASSVRTTEVRSPLVRDRKFSAQDRMFFAERLGLLLETGTPLHPALETLAGQARAGAPALVIGDLSVEVASGRSFSEALAAQPAAFPETHVNLVAAGERGGFLPEVIGRLLEMEERARELRSTLVGALSYPAFLTVFSFAVVVFVLVVVFPKFSEMFAMIVDDLPVTTRFLMAASDLLRNNAVVVTVAVVGAAGGAWRLVASEQGREWLDETSFRLPGIRTLVSELYLVQFLRVMSLSIGHGVPVVEALDAARSAVASPRFRRFVHGLRQNVTDGRLLSAGFQNVDFVPELAAQMVATGEESGSLALVMGRLADFYEREWRRRIEAAAKMIEPALLLVMGVVVGMIVSSLLLPIFMLSRSVG